MYPAIDLCYNKRMDETTFFQLIQSGTVTGAYLLFGAEPYSREHAVRQLIATVDSATRDLNVQVLRNPLPEDVMGAGETLPFFAKKRVVIIRELSADCASALANYVAKMPQTTLLLIEQPGKPNVQSTLYKMLHSLDRTVEFSSFEPDRAIAFIEKRAKERGVDIDRTATRRMVDWFGTDLSLLENTLYSLAGYVGEQGCITLKTVETCVTPASEFKIFSVLDDLIAGNKRDAVRQLLSMIKSGADTAMRLSAFFEGRIRQMVQAKRMLLAGEREQAIAKTLGGSPYAAKKTVHNAKKCRLEQLVSALEAFAAVDWQQKQGMMKDDDALMIAIFQNF
ncbi:MAG: DNA polymerase III subunit delta [Clostridia bacterium]